MPSYYVNGLPPDLDAKLAAVRLRADLDFDEAKKGQRPLVVRQLLIDRRIIPEVLAFVGVACEMAKREWLSIGAVEREVQNYQRALARRLCPDSMTDSAWDQWFQREVSGSLESRHEWRECRRQIAETAEALLAVRSPQAQVPLRVSFDYAAADLESEAGRRAAVPQFLAWCKGPETPEPTLNHFAAAMGHSSARQLQYWMSAKPGPKATKATDRKARRVLQMSPSKFWEAVAANTNG